MFLLQLAFYWVFLIYYFVFRLCKCLPLPGLKASFLPLYHVLLVVWLVCCCFFVVVASDFGFLFCAPALSSQLPAITCLCQHYLWHIFSHSYSSLSVHVDDPSAPSGISAHSVFLLRVALTPQASETLFSSACSSSLRSPLSVLPPACPAVFGHQPFHYFSLLCFLRTRGLRSILAFPLLSHEVHVMTSRPVCISPSFKIITLVPVRTVLSHLLKFLSFSGLNEFTQSYTVKNSLFRLLKCSSMWASADCSLRLTKLMLFLSAFKAYFCFLNFVKQRQCYLICILKAFNMLALCWSGSPERANFPLKRKQKAEVDAVTGEVHHVIVTGLAAAQHGAGGVLVEESAVWMQNQA